MTRSNVVVAPYRTEDAEGCATVFARAWNDGHPHAPRQLGVGEFLSETVDERVVVARTAGGRIVGFASIYLPDNFVHHVYVDPAWKRQGIGRALLSEVVAMAGGQVSLKCQLRNTEALRFYEHEGWTPMEAGQHEGEPWVRLRSPGYK
jgi:GNAT superfamily N-acetyltransferase